MYFDTNWPFRFGQSCLLFSVLEMTRMTCLTLKVTWFRAVGNSKNFDKTLEISPDPKNMMLNIQKNIEKVLDFGKCFIVQDQTTTASPQDQVIF